MYREKEPDEETEKAKKTKSFNEFLRKNKDDIKKLKKEFDEATEAGIQDLLFLIWLIEDDEKKVLSKAKRLLSELFHSGWISSLLSFKLRSEGE
ncbi:MAG: hypothetical protein ACPL06_03495 [Candidatus Anstonellales archaeon]